MKRFLYYLRTEKLKDFIPFYWKEFLRWIGCYRTYTWKQTDNRKPGELLNMTCEKLSTVWYLFGIKVYTKPTQKTNSEINVQPDGSYL